MCNTRSNVFLQSMKNNTLSVKKLMKNLILRTLRQLYAVSEIIILIRWVTPPPKVEIPQIIHILQLCKIFTVSVVFHHWLYIYEFMSSTTFTYSYVFTIESFELSECDRTLISLCFLSQTLSVQIICILLKLSNVFSAS